MSKPDYKALCADIVRASDAVSHDAAAAEGDFEAAIDNARAALEAQPEPVWTEGICGDGAAILKDGVMQPIEDVIAALNATALAQPEPVAPTGEALANFSGWFCRNYPGPDTIIHKPEWHAPKVFRAAAYALARWGTPANNTKEENQ
jgi:hypothetical protein